jgi:polyribonucleotide nucleotidyltransferase
MESKTFKKKVDNKEFIVESKNLAEQANGNILVRIGDTLVMTTCVMGKEDRASLGFFPLTVEYEEKYYAAGKIKGSRYIKRESRPSDEAILNARLIDRAIRPRFPKHLMREIQVVSTILSWDGQNDPDVLGLTAASLALSISDIPWSGPVAAVRVCSKNGQLTLNPTYEERENCELDIVFAGVEEKNNVIINMIEGGADEAGEDLVLKALNFAEKPLKEIIDFQKEIIKEIGKEKAAIEPPPADEELEKEIKGFLGDRMEKAIYQKDKSSAGIGELEKEACKFVEEKYQGQGKARYCQDFFQKEVDRLIHENIIKYKKRPDGRKLDEVREIYCEAGVLPRTHGSGLFCRGQTKALSILTLGSPGDQQLLEGMEVVGKKRFMHHYNFPPYSSGEIKPMRGPGRREIGHGMLAEKALLPLIPTSEQFPYTIRIVSEIVSSNGSTSMASVSSSSLALMDAGVPIKRPATGIAIGLIRDENSENYEILTDIQGPEDHHGDMDFKVAGTRSGITAIQMDVKISGIDRKIMEEALSGAKKARLGILDKIENVLPQPRPELSPFAPRIITIQIDPEKIREVIGPGGKVINEIIDKTGATIDIQDSGLVFVTSEKEESAKKAVEWIKNIIKEVQVGENYEGKVKRILEFGAFVEILPGQEGMIHISKLAPYRVRKVEDIVKIGDEVSVKVISIDEQGRINLALQQNNKK